MKHPNKLLTAAKRLLRRLIAPSENSWRAWAWHIWSVWGSILLISLFLTKCGPFWVYQIRVATDTTGSVFPYERAAENAEDEVKELAKKVPKEVLDKLPPDPGEEGKKTLLGIDSNNDGLRDDLERFVAIRFHGRPTIQRYMREDLKFMTRIAATSGNKAQSVAATTEYLQFTDCRRWHWGEISKHLMRYTDIAFMNTAERYAAHVAAARHFSGESWPGFLEGEERERFCRRYGLGGDQKSQAEKDVKMELYLHGKR